MASAKPTIVRSACGVLIVAISVLGAIGRAGGQENTAAATQQYEAAADLQNRGDYGPAAEQWAKFIDTYRTDPRLDRAFHYLGVCYLKAGKLDLAQQCFEIVPKFFPKFELLEVTYLDLGVTQYKLGEAGKAEMYDAAAAAFETLLSKYPEGAHAAEALFYRGESLYRRGRKTEAVAMYAQLLARFPDDKRAGDALYALGVSREELGQYADAGTTYKAFLEKFAQSPLAAEVAMRRAALRAGLRQYAEAAALYASVPAKWPESKLAATADLAAGRCYYLAGDFAEARKLLEPAVAAGGESAGEATHWLVRSLLKEGKPAEAAALLEKTLPPLGQSAATAQLMMDQADAIYDIPQRRGQSGPLYATIAAKYSEDPLAPQALYMAGFVALNQGEFAAALKHAAAFFAAYGNDQRVADMTYVAAESRLQLGQFAEAGKLFAELLEKYPTRADAATWKVRLGLSLFMQKKYAETVAILQPVLPGLHARDALAEANYLLGGSQLELKQPEAAARSLEASLAAQPKWRQADDVLLLLAQAYGELDNGEKARAVLDRLVGEFPESRLLDRAHYRLAENAYAGGDFPAALAEYHRVIDNWPQSPLARQALFGLGWVKLGQNDARGAETLFDEWLQKYADDKLAPRVRYAQHGQTTTEGFRRALDDVRALLAADPPLAEKSNARYLLGLCEAGLQKYADAAKTFQTLLGDDPKYAGGDKVLYELAWALRRQGKEKPAVETFTRLTVEHPDSPLAAEANYHAGEFAYQSGDFQAAAAACHAARQAAESLGQAELAEKAAFWEGESQMKQKKFANALAAYQQVNPAGKDFGALALLHAGQAAGRLAQWDKSLDLLSHCIEQFPDSPYLTDCALRGRLGEAKPGQARRLRWRCTRRCW